MTPKEKAKELYEYFDQLFKDHTRGVSVRDIAKQCAIKTVDEIIEALKEYDDRNNTDELQNMDRDFVYWSKVKQEIEKL